MDQRIMRSTGERIPVARIACAIVLAVLAAAAFSARPLAAADGNYHLLKKVVLGGEGSGTISFATVPRAASTFRGART